MTYDLYFRPRAGAADAAALFAHRPDQCPVHAVLFAAGCVTDGGLETGHRMRRTAVGHLDLVDLRTFQVHFQIKCAIDPA